QPDKAQSPFYWGEQLYRPVQFSRGVTAVDAQYADSVFIEVGPGRILTSFVNSHNQVETVNLMAGAKEVDLDASRMITEARIKLWLHGIGRIYPETPYQFIDLPGYEFDLDRYWIELLEVEKPGRDSISVNQVCEVYQSSWEYLSKLSPVHDENEITGCWLIFTDNYGYLTDWVSRLESANQTVIHVLAVPELEDVVVELNSIKINPYKSSHYAELQSHLVARNISPRHVIHGWTLTNPDSPLNIEQIQWYGFLSLYLWQKEIRVSCEHQVTLSVLSNGLCQVTGDDSLQPEKGTLIGAVRNLVHETPGLSANIIDCDYSAWDPEHVLEFVTKSEHLEESPLFALRGRYFWQQHYRKIDTSTAKSYQVIKNGDVIIISGGLGGVGLALAKEIASHHEVSFILVGRHGVKNSKTSAQYKLYQQNNIEEIRKLGSEVVIESCDLGNNEQVALLISKIKNQFSRIDSIIHAAGVAPMPVSQRSLDGMFESLKGKVFGLANLLQALSNDKLRFVATTSSLSSWLGDVGRLEYCAANSYLDTISGSTLPNIGRFITVQWPGWSGVGLAVKDTAPGNIETINDDKLALISKNYVEEQEGAGLFYKLLGMVDYDQVAVSKIDLYSLRSIVFGEKQNNEIADSEEVSKLLIEDNVSDTENTIAGIYHTVLGCTGISRDDNYYELGGNSLSAIRLVNQLNTIFKINLNVSVISEYPCVQKLSQYIDAMTHNVKVLDEGEF
ncbi:MAG: SDR family NAD(P)-dependent oxidoreductase, partial [Thioalkalispiraceae bacterium]